MFDPVEPANKILRSHPGYIGCSNSMINHRLVRTFRQEDNCRHVLLAPMSCYASCKQNIFTNMIRTRVNLGICTQWCRIFRGKLIVFIWCKRFNGFLELRLECIIFLFSARENGTVNIMNSVGYSQSPVLARPGSEERRYFREFFFFVVVSLENLTWLEITHRILYCFLMRPFDQLWKQARSVCLPKTTRQQNDRKQATLCSVMRQGIVPVYEDLRDCLDRHRWFCSASSSGKN